MIDPDISLQKPLEDYIEIFAKQTSRSIAIFENMVDEGIIFQDPYRRGQGGAGIIKILSDRFKIYKSARYNVRDFMWGRTQHTAYMYWSFIFEIEKRHITRKEKLLYSIAGMSELVFSPLSRKIISHTDFWGEHSNFDIKAYKALQDS